MVTHPGRRSESSKSPSRPPATNHAITTISKPNRPVQSAVTEGTTSMVYPFSENKRGLALLKNNNAAGRVDDLGKQLKYIGHVVHKWLL